MRKGRERRDYFSTRKNALSPMSLAFERSEAYNPYEKGKKTNRRKRPFLEKERERRRKGDPPIVIKEIVGTNLFSRSKQKKEGQY